MLLFAGFIATISARGEDDVLLVNFLESKGSNEKILGDANQLISKW